MVFVERLTNFCCMKVSEFERLAQNEQLNLLYREGAFIGKLRREQFINLLFQLYDFYVEVIYTKYRFTIHSIRCSGATDFLDPYLPQINL